MKTDPKIVHAIEQAICQTMPSAAIASGWMSGVDPTAWIQQMSERFPFNQRPDQMGMPMLTTWLESQGVKAGESFIKALRIEWLKERMRRESAKLA